MGCRTGQTVLDIKHPPNPQIGFYTLSEYVLAKRKHTPKGNLILKYILLILVPSSILQWLLLLVCGVGGWFLFSTQFKTSKKSTAMVNVLGAVCGIAFFTD